jgi:hypothetical protein
MKETTKTEIRVVSLLMLIVLIIQNLILAYEIKNTQT